jgi:hypothetical protein
MNTIKNVHSPAGMTYYAGAAYWVNLIDCPSCKYGTLDRTETGAKCADCKRVFTIEELVKLGIIKPEKTP